MSLRPPGDSTAVEGSGSGSGPVYIDGINEPLPEGETLLWEGRPELIPLAMRALYLRLFIIYWAVLAVVWLGHGIATGRPGSALAADLTWLVVVGLVGSGMVLGLAWAVRRSTTYALTDRRVVMRMGVALPAVLNLPLEKIQEANFRGFRDGTGLITFRLPPSERMGVVFLWPHHRPWRWGRPEPAFRALPDAEQVAQRVGEAAQAALGGSGPQVTDADRPRRSHDDSLRREMPRDGVSGGDAPAAAGGLGT